MTLTLRLVLTLKNGTKLDQARRAVRPGSPGGLTVCPAASLAQDAPGRLKIYHSIEQTIILLFFISNPTFPTPFASSVVYDDLGCSKWQADLRTTLGALSLTGSLPGQRSLVFSNVSDQGGQTTLHRPLC
jgi:hypothetical protein